MVATRAWGREGVTAQDCCMSLWADGNAQMVVVIAILVNVLKTGL